MILSVRPQTLNTMVPRLLRPPHTSTNLKALGSLAEVAGPAIHNHLSHIMPVLLKTAGLVPAEKAAGAAARDSTRRVRLSVDHWSPAAQQLMPHIVFLRCFCKCPDQDPSGCEDVVSLMLLWSGLQSVSVRGRS